MTPTTDHPTDRVRRLILDTLPGAADENTKIFGQGSGMDSLGLVNFLADLEYRLATEFQRDLVLASDRAMSRERSPFRDVSSLEEYIVELLHE